MNDELSRRRGGRGGLGEMVKCHSKRARRSQLLLIYSFIMAMIIICCSLCAYAATDGSGEAELVDDMIQGQSDASGLDKIEEQLKEHSDRDIEEILGDYDPERIISDAATGKLELNLKSIMGNILRYLFKELYTNVDILIKLIVLIILCAVLKNLQDSFMREGAGEVAFYVCYIVIVSILLVSFNSAMKMGANIIDEMTGFMYATMPVMITMLVSGGNITTGGIFQPVMLMIVEISATVIRNVFLPMIFFSTVLSVVNNISDKIQISKLANLIRQITGWMLGAILAVFIGTVSVQGSFGAVIDGVTSKTAKFAMTAFIPVVGKTLSDAADTVLGCTLLIKNAAGLAAMIGVLVICLVPLLKILALVLLYKGVCAIVEPVSDKRITGCISDVAGSMMYILGVTSAVTLMFLITITALISAGNLSAMIR